MRQGPNFERLCEEAQRRGLRPGLVAGTRLRHRPGLNGTTLKWREIVALELTNDEKHVVLVEPMRGLDDLERAAGALL